MCKHHRLKLTGWKSKSGACTSPQNGNTISLKTHRKSTWFCGRNVEAGAALEADLLATLHAHFSCTFCPLLVSPSCPSLGEVARGHHPRPPALGVPRLRREGPHEREERGRLFLTHGSCCGALGAAAWVPSTQALVTPVLPLDPVLMVFLAAANLRLPQHPLLVPFKSFPY